MVRQAHHVPFIGQSCPNPGHPACPPKRERRREPVEGWTRDFMIERYYSFNQEIKKIFGERIDRITINAGMTCPNIDGKKAKGGCSFCQDASYWGKSLFDGGGDRLSIKEQIEKGIKYLQNRFPSRHFFAYFQNGTNTYAPVETLKSLWNEALSFKEIVGLIISTRPDCIYDDVLNLLSEYHQKTYLWVELGIPSHRDDHNASLNRAHTVAEFQNTLARLKNKSIRVCAHVILGLPGETREDVIEKALFFNTQPMDAIKIHNLVVFKKTLLAKFYSQGKYQPLTLNDYVTWCVDFVEHLRPDIIIQRLEAHGPRELTVAPQWSINKMATLNAIHAELEKRNSWQGRLLHITK